MLATALVAMLAAAAPSFARERPSPPTTGELLRAPLPPPVAGTSAYAPYRLPNGETRVFPKYRVVSLYGAPQLTGTIVGRVSPLALGRRLRRVKRKYRRAASRRVVGAFDVIATVATADPGDDGKYRFRQRDRLIAAYLQAARRARARLVLDVQPGRSSFLTEVRALKKWLVEPDVDVGLDPEWNVGPRGVPLRTPGYVRARTVNRVSSYLRRLTLAHRLPQKLLVVHQFRTASVRSRGRIVQRRRVAVTLNFDGIGGRRAKVAGYRRLSRRHLFSGFSLFYRLDNRLMRPLQVVGLTPSPDYVMYQ